MENVEERKKLGLKKLPSCLSIVDALLYLKQKEEILLMELFETDERIKTQRTSNAVKPHLKDENKAESLAFSLSMLEPGLSVFKAMYNMVHVDEKWFFSTKLKRNFYPFPDEEGPHRTVSNQTVCYEGRVFYCSRPTTIQPPSRGILWWENWNMALCSKGTGSVKLEKSSSIAAYKAPWSQWRKKTVSWSTKRWFLLLINYGQLVVETCALLSNIITPLRTSNGGGPELARRLEQRTPDRVHV